MSLVSCIIPGEPSTITAQQKGVLVRGGRPMFFTKAKVKAAQDALTVQLRRHAPRQPIDYPVLFKIKFVFGRTKSRPFENVHGKRPDLDNLVKGVLDCLQPAGWLTDDALIDALAVVKCRSDEPRLEIEMREL